MQKLVTFCSHDHYQFQFHLITPFFFYSIDPENFGGKFEWGKFILTSSPWRKSFHLFSRGFLRCRGELDMQEKMEYMCDQSLVVLSHPSPEWQLKFEINLYDKYSTPQQGRALIELKNTNEKKV